MMVHCATARSSVVVQPKRSHASRVSSSWSSSSSSSSLTTIPASPTTPVALGRQKRPALHTQGLSSTLVVASTTTMDALSADTFLSSLPFIGLLSTTLAFSIVKLTAYSQLEVVRTAMLSRHVKNGGANVLQLGGTTRDLYYYPPKTLSVTINDPDLSPSLFEQAGITVGIPATASKLQLTDCLSKTPSGSVDSVVSFNQFNAVVDPAELKSIVREVARVLKPGGTFIFYERRKGQGVVGMGAGCALEVGELVGGLDVWDFCEWDVAASGLDGHDVGVGVKGLEGTGEGEVGGSVDGSAFEAMIRRGKAKVEKEQGNGAGFG